jgi:hypothetical protein
MKRISTLFILFILSSLAVAQIPNSSFELWTDNQLDDWLTTNIITMAANVSKVNDAHHGSAAVKGEVISFQDEPYAPVLWTSFPFSTRPASLTGYFKFFPTSGDEFFAAIALYKGADLIGAGVYQTDDTKSSYTQFYADIIYISAEVPDMAIITIGTEGSDGDDPNVGTYYIVDHLELSNITDVKDGAAPLSFNLEQNYPNPFNPSTVISYQVASEEFVLLKVYDIIGNEVAVLVNEVKQPGSYKVSFNAGSLSNGMYIYSITAGKFKQTRKMVLLK